MKPVSILDMNCNENNNDRSIGILVPLVMCNENVPFADTTNKKLIDWPFSHLM